MSDEKSQDADRKDQRTKERRKLQKRELKLRERLEEARNSQMAALERFRRLEARLQKRIGHVNKLETRLYELQTLLYGESLLREEASTAPVIFPLRILNAEGLPGLAEPHLEGSLPALALVDDSNQTTLDGQHAIIQPPEMAELLKRAREATEAAESSVRRTAGRAQSVLARQASIAVNHDSSPAFAEPQSSEIGTQAALADHQETDKHPGNSSEEFPSASLPAPQVPLFALPEFDVDSEEEDEENLVSALASLMIAEATATAAAHAEAVAGEKSALTEQARRQVDQADQTLRRVRAAITNRDLVAGDATLALQEAENEVERSLQLLLSAEKAEDLARRSAKSVATSATIREEMAHFSMEQTELAELTRDEEGDLA